MTLQRVALAALDGPGYVLNMDSQDIAASIDNIKPDALGEDPEDITGTVELVGDGEILELWVTTYRAPWNLDSIYTRVF